MAARSVRPDWAREHWRMPGCTYRCGQYFVRLPGQAFAEWISSHDPEGHEEYGRLSTTRELARLSCRELVETGPLLLDGETGLVFVDGRSISLTPTEFAIVAYLGHHLGGLVSHQELLVSVWGPGYGVALTGQTSWRAGLSYDSHLVRVAVARLRGKLGPASSLITTVKGVGYRLERVAPTGGPS